MHRILVTGLLAIGFGAAGAQANAAASASDFDRPRESFVYELTVGDLGWKTSGPFTGITKNFRRNPIPYRMTYAAVSVSHPVRWRHAFWRNFEFVHSAVWSSITSGPENHWGGVTTGFRYQHPLPARFHSSLFVSFQGGVGAIDSSGRKYAQETDLTFAFVNAIGVRTRITDTVSLDLQLLGKHLSNGWQTKPSEGIDCSGFSFALSYRPRPRR